MKEVQKINVNIDNNFDTFRVTILNPDNGEYILNFQNPTDFTYYASKPIKADGDSSHIYW
jgi:hypothetical protein